jgi:hypothetical protein
MELELRTVVLETERRWNWREFFNEKVSPIGRVAGEFLAYRDDETFAWLHTFDRGEERETLAKIVASGPPRKSESVRRLASSHRSTIASTDDLASLNDFRVVELRHYRVASGTRGRFVDFLFDRTLEAQRACDMAVFGPFDDLDDDNVVTWFRAFPSLAERDRRKAAFYQSRLWLDELEAEAFSMIERYEVMLVEPQRSAAFQAARR